MLPRLRRPGGGTRGARRKSMRPWHEPGASGGVAHSNGTTPSVCWEPSGTTLPSPAAQPPSPVTQPRATGARRCNHRRHRAAQPPPRPPPRTPRPSPAEALRRVTGAVPPPRPQAHSSHRRSALAVDSNGSTTVDNQPFFVGPASAARRYRPPPAPPPRTPAPPLRTPLRRAYRAHAPEVSHVPRARRPAPEGPVRRSAREMARTSRAGPPPAGNGAAVSPSPPSPVRRADPRRVHGSASTPVRRERTAGRTATRPGHIRPPPPPPPATRAALGRPSDGRGTTSGAGHNPAIRTHAP